MTIRQYLQTKANAFAWPIIALALLGLALRISGLALTPLGFSAVLASFATILLVCVVLAVRFRCPRCSGPLSSLIAHFGPMRKLGRKIQFCPFCGVKMDEPLKA
jgi:hypothetical protein